MTLTQAQQISLAYLQKENLKNFTLTSFDLSPKYSNDIAQNFLGYVDYLDDDGSDVSTVFNLIVFNDGRIKFKWL